MNSRTCRGIISFEGEIGLEANDLVNCIPERGHNWIIKQSILFVIRCTTNMSTVLVVTSALAGFGVIPVFDVWLAQLLHMRFALGGSPGRPAIVAQQ